MTLQSGFKPQTIQALSPIHISELLAQTETFQRPLSESPLNSSRVTPHRTPPHFSALHPPSGGARQQQQGDIRLGHCRQARTAALPTSKETSCKEKKPNDAENVAAAQRHVAPGKESHAAQPAPAPTHPKCPQSTRWFQLFLAPVPRLHSRAEPCTRPRVSRAGRSAGQKEKQTGGRQRRAGPPTRSAGSRHGDACRGHHRAPRPARRAVVLHTGAEGAPPSRRRPGQHERWTSPAGATQLSSTLR